MFFKNSYKNKNEPFLEPVLRELRFGIALADLKKILDKNSIILDYGCGPEAKFYTYLKDKNINFKKYFGYDPLLKKDINKKNLFITSDWIKIQKYKFDLITMFAVIEHVPYPNFNYRPIINRLKNMKYLLITTPTKLAKPVLEFLSYKLGIVSRREIEEHQHYFNLEEIKNLFKKLMLRIEKKMTFEIGMNNYILLKK